MSLKYKQDLKNAYVIPNACLNRNKTKPGILPLLTGSTTQSL